jgi:hypothetical protein
MEPDGEVGAEPGSAGRSLVGAGIGAASGLETGGAAEAAMGGAALLALLLRGRWLVGIIGRCMPGGPYGPGLMERGPGRGPGDIERAPGMPPGPGDMERGIAPGPGDIDRGAGRPPGPGDMERGTAGNWGPPAGPG